MGYLIAQILVCLVVAFALGLLLGWLLWAGRRETTVAQVDEGEIEAARQRIRTLEADLADCRAVDPPTFVNPPPTTPPDPPPVAPPPSPSGSGGVLGFGPPAAAPTDDLKVISGIGPVIEKQLAGLGILTYAQIAGFSESDVQRVGEALGVFSGRIAREDWIAQAQRLAGPGFGAEAAGPAHGDES